MPNTYTQLYVQIVFAVKGRQNLISHEHKNELHSYMTGVVKKRGVKLLAIHCMPDHTHLFVSFGPTLTIADLVRDVKSKAGVRSLSGRKVMVHLLTANHKLKM